MRSGWRMAAVGLLLAGAAGCSRLPLTHRSAPPPQAQAPSQPPWEMARLIPPMPPLPPYQARPVLLNAIVTADVQQPVEELPPHRSRHHPRPPSQDVAPPEAGKSGTASPGSSANTEIASGQPPEMSPLGQLSTANNNSNAADRQLILDQINATENTLNGIHRPLTKDEQKTAALIRTFITKAREALKLDDLDGAGNFDTKAKILLRELTKE